MEGILSNISRQDIYNVVVPIIVALIGGFISKFSQTKVWKEERQWKQVKKKSSGERYITYVVSYMIVGLVCLILYSLIIYIMEAQIGIPINKVIEKIIYIVAIIIVYLHLLKQEKDVSLVVFKKEYKYEKYMLIFMYNAPIILSFTIYFFACYNLRILLMIAEGLFVLLEVVPPLFLDAESKFEYQYASFYFYDGKEYVGMKAENTYQKGNWIITKDGINNNEYRFRMKDIQRIEYKN